jgi:hypothetical protein
MRTLLKLTVAALIVHATWRVGAAYWDHYQFEDAVKETAQFAERATPEAIEQQVLGLAADQGIPLDAAAVEVTRATRTITVDGAYVREIEVLPRYVRPWDFTFHVTVYTLN